MKLFFFHLSTDNFWKERHLMITTSLLTRICIFLSLILTSEKKENIFQKYDNNLYCVKTTNFEIDTRGLHLLLRHFARKKYVVWFCIEDFIADRCFVAFMTTDM